MEKRRQIRRRTSLSMKVHDSKSGDLTGQLIDLTTGGMRLISIDPIAVGHIFNFKVEVPPTVSERKILTIHARSVWSKKDSDFGFFDTGFEFIELSSWEQDTIEKPLAKFLFKD